jgi:hypothetical protein
MDQRESGEGVNIAGVIKNLVVSDDAILAARTLRSLLEHLIALETFCLEIDIDKTIVVKFSLKKKTTQTQIRTENELLEIIQNYK